ncbi:hypothetical protein NPS01_33370 [Nocardioides psychrotolerans]|uniref:Methyltransferase domain-containing protein n=1 Tax=Nocardioides psychrotolerans TaxID=1005945 RepID=A0A1I3PFX9_9ACTN|nr:class I SAM-dependent methyltransferase [Nocardioides psychrotolerans]GEP39674.1 hypothetical protein NPS01_33370 [Nocardioides psychrotolerans]SFJ20257.1 Methyltransferase domain-containing protein [Nocardioides psychrotolerans]
MDPADFYSGIVVDAYARLKSSTFDPEPYVRFVQRHGEPALEIGCGDGEPLLDLCAAGLDVDGVDSSADMVARCREKAAERGLTTGVFHQRAESLDLERRYASIYFAGPTFNLLPDDDTASRALHAIRDHLTEDGAALVPLWVPAPTPPDDFDVTLSASEDPDVELRYTSLSEVVDPQRRTRVTTARYERVTPAGVEVADREWLIHWHTPSGFHALCASAGLRVVSLVNDETGSPAPEASTTFTATVTREEGPP